VTDKSVVIDYTNHRGERAERWILPEEMWFGESSYHDGPQWFVRAFDMQKFAHRDFAMSGIHGIRQTERTAA
jgi:predicted DNA-binding transcriptional regulator YafY